MADSEARSERRLFAAALRLDGEARDRFLRGLGGEDAEVEARIRALLAAHERPELASAVFVPPALSVPEPERLGPYRLLERVGEGGMGVVYVAEQTEPVRRRVALKLIKGASYSREMLGRFHSERQALALMNHPNIARILDAGSTEDGRPYFVMEYVEGGLLLDYCDRRALSIDERLRFFVQVCDAVQHAHQKGVIHRDLKPSNILVEEVDGKATPKVIDFGVAKTLHERLSDITLHTRLGGFIGTPEYVSPEQARTGGLDIDTRTDVYSLGTVLYELLTGLRPFEFGDADFRTIQEVLVEQDPKLPSVRVLEGGDAARARADRRGTDPDGLRRRLRGDLDWITMKALEKDRSRRYAGASELAADLQRHRALETVVARPPSTAYRVGRFARRHAVLLTLGALAILGLVVGSIGTSLGMIRARDEAARARVHAAIAEEVNAFLNNDLLAAVAPGRQGIDVSMREVLDTAAQRIDGRFADQPLVEASLRRTIGTTYHSLGVHDVAEAHLLRSVELFERELGTTDPKTRAVYLELGTLFRARGRFADAERVLETVRAAGEGGAGDALGLAALEELAIVHHQSGRFEQAEALYLEVVEARDAVSGRDHPDTMRVLGRLAIVYRYLERWQEAEAIHREALSINRRHFGEEHPRTLVAISRLAALYLAWGRTGEAEQLLRQSLDPTRRVLGEEHPNTLILINNLGWLYLEQGRYEEAETLLLEAFEVKQRVLGELHPSTVEGLQNLVVLYGGMGARDRHAEYEARFADVLDRVCAGPTARTEDRLEYADLLLSATATELRDPDRALALARQAVDDTERRDAEALWVLARAQARTGARDRAADVAREALGLVPEASDLRARLAAFLDSLAPES